MSVLLCPSSPSCLRTIVALPVTSRSLVNTLPRTCRSPIKVVVLLPLMGRISLTNRLVAWHLLLKSADLLSTREVNTLSFLAVIPDLALSLICLCARVIITPVSPITWLPVRPTTTTGVPASSEGWTVIMASSMTSISSVTVARSTTSPEGRLVLNEPRSDTCMRLAETVPTPRSSELVCTSVCSWVVCAVSGW